MVIFDITSYLDHEISTLNFSPVNPNCNQVKSQLFITYIFHVNNT